MDTIFQQKSVLREKYLEKRMTLSKDEVFLFSKGIFDTFISNFEIKSNSKIHCFLPIVSKNEIDTSFFFDYCFKHNIRIFVPKVVGDKIISIEINPDSEFKISKWNIQEPVSNLDSGEIEFDICITPLVYCDPLGNRIGYGKGFYDKFFEENKVISKIGLSFYKPVECVDNVFKTDVRLDYLITPNYFFVF
ncbi:5-formyltetrahydrofolate cyclo-ligase [Soonwooa purpurea]